MNIFTMGSTIHIADVESTSNLLLFKAVFNSQVGFPDPTAHISVTAQPAPGGHGCPSLATPSSLDMYVPRTVHGHRCASIRWMQFLARKKAWYSRHIPRRVWGCHASSFSARLQSSTHWPPHFKTVASPEPYSSLHAEWPWFRVHSRRGTALHLLHQGQDLLQENSPAREGVLWIHCLPVQWHE